MKHDLKWFEEYAENRDMLKPLEPSEWKELAVLLHGVNHDEPGKASRDWLREQQERAREGWKWEKPDALRCKWCGLLIQTGDYCAPDKKACAEQAAVYKDHVRGGGYDSE